MSAWPEPIHGVIFDIDGLLLDTEPIFVMAMEKTTGHPLSKESYIKLMGRSGFEAAPWIIEKYSLSYTEEEVVNKIDENLSSLLPNAKLFPGTHNLVARLKEMKLPLGLATGVIASTLEIGQDHIKSFFTIPMCYMRRRS